MLTDIEIAQATEPKPIGEIAAIAGVDEKVPRAVRQLQGEGRLQPAARRRSTPRASSSW
ncbi:MAG: hypothetical protein ACLTDR_01370 [Adlercreutzia equolifaciens]